MKDDIVEKCSKVAINAFVKDLEYNAANLETLVSQFRDGNKMSLNKMSLKEFVKQTIPYRPTVDRKKRHHDRALLESAMTKILNLSAESVAITDASCGTSSSSTSSRSDGITSSSGSSSSAFSGGGGTSDGISHDGSSRSDGISHDGSSSSAFSGGGGTSDGISHDGSSRGDGISSSSGSSST